MKVKAKCNIICDEGVFRTGETFEIDASKLPTYGDAVEAVGKSAAPAKPAEEAKPEDQATEEPVAEKPKTPAPRRKKTAVSK